MSGAVEAIGIIADAMGIWSFIADQIPPVKTPESNYRVTIGLNGFKDSDGHSLSGADGSIELIKVYDVQHELIGSGSGGTVDGNDQYGDMTAEQDGNLQSIWTEFYASDDAICIAAITATMDEGTKWGWTGDWGYMCGLPWFPSGYVMQNKDNKDNVSPRCTWIDKNHHNGYPAAAIGINWPDLRPADGDKPPSEDEAKKKCGKTMQAWDSEGGKQILPVSSKRRDLARRSQRSDDRLIVSSIESHNATEVCESHTSWGPDFVSTVNGIYCNMETHEAVPLCKGNDRAGCFDLDNSNGAAMVNFNGKRSTREFSGIVQWGV